MSGEDAIRQRAREFESLKDLTSVLSSEHLKSAKHLPELQRLQQVRVTLYLNITGYNDFCLQINIEQQDAAGELSDEVKSLFARYNSIVSFLNKHHCVQ